MVVGAAVVGVGVVAFRVLGGGRGQGDFSGEGSGGWSMIGSGGGCRFGLLPPLLLLLIICFRDHPLNQGLGGPGE